MPATPPPPSRGVACDDNAYSTRPRSSDGTCLQGREVWILRGERLDEDASSNGSPREPDPQLAARQVYPSRTNCSCSAGRKILIRRYNTISRSCSTVSWESTSITRGRLSRSRNRSSVSIPW
jgi:hypothetical protein